MKYLFLDIDGVLNSSDTEVEEPFAQNMREEPHLPLLDRKLCKLLNQVLLTGVSVVVSSTHRVNFPDPQPLETWLKVNGAYHAKIVGSTPTLGETRYRGKEVLSYMLNHRIDKEDVVIVDDEHFDFEAWGLGSRFVQVDDGLTSLAVSCMLRLLDKL